MDLRERGDGWGNWEEKLWLEYSENNLFSIKKLKTFDGSCFVLGN